MKVVDVMTSPIPLLSPTMSWKAAAEFFANHHLSAAPVVDEHHQLVGILSEKDLFRGLFPSYREWISHPEDYLDFEEMEQAAIHHAADQTVEQVMTKNFISAHVETPLLKIGALMVARGIHQVPVLDQQYKVIGMVQRGIIYTAILHHYFGINKT